MQVEDSGAYVPALKPRFAACVCFDPEGLSSQECLLTSKVKWSTKPLLACLDNIQRYYLGCLRKVFKTCNWPECPFVDRNKSF